MNSNVEELLRHIPLYNIYGKDFPQERVTRLQIPEFKLPSLQPPRDLVYPWYEECDNITKVCQLHDSSSKKFDQWYKEHYMSKKPPGIVGNTLLSPSKKEDS
ncbi:ubiquitin-binding ESCRT-I subunit protein MVB12 [Saccharomyces paradoxus]|uniref:Ubiquitin-binding ESCRT-I subunit protein MVB12 n=1 Tax=Saccharomyces paradoxus TaxID=27291 RepID=A0A8B8US77_SACPA|nr:Mvb12 [Saccharomyces paradoxus]QHS73509.1 Mvb12 [Saccharomyces paradoxus]